MNATETNLYNDLTRLFEGRPELIEDKERDFASRAKAIAFRYFNGQEELSIRDTLSLSDAGRKLLSDAYQEFKEYAEKLFLFPESRISVRGAHVMTSGSTFPVKVNLSISNGGENNLERTMFLKRQDPLRLAGIGLYRTLGNVAQDYNFVFNQQIIAEEGIVGEHIDLAKKRPLDDRTIRERIKLDAVAFFLGLDDISKPANSIVTPKRKIICIDHDAFDREYSSEDIHREQTATANDLGLNIKDYSKIFNEEVRLLNDRVKANKDSLETMARVLIDSRDRITSGVGRYILANIYNAIREGS